MNRRILMQGLEFVCRLGLGALFIYSALAKVSDPDEFAYSVSRYEMLPGFTIGLFSLTMPMLELLAGVAMLFTKWLRESALLVSGMLAMFIVALTQALVRGLDISCGCFGVPSVGGQREIVMALVRDVVLIVPSVWLMFRTNALIEPLGRLPKVWHTVVLCVAGAALAALFAREEGMWGNGGSGAARPAAAKAAGAALRPGSAEAAGWNGDFTNVLARAEREQRPMLLLVVGEGCSHCARLEKSMRGGAFRLWCADRAPLLSLVKDGSAQTPQEMIKAAKSFVTNTTEGLKGYPYVCLYWPRNDATNRVAFCGRGGQMGVKRQNSLAMEMMMALDDALGVRPGDGHKTLDELVKGATIKISARSDGDGGKVTMSPVDGVLPEGKTVELYAKPTMGNVFLDWRLPDGSFAGWESHLTVYGNMPAGRYTARFRNVAECKPPVLLSPAEVSIDVQVGDWFRHEIRVEDSCRPVKFYMTRPAVGIKVNPATGVVTGVLTAAKTNVVEIAVVGHDPDQTAKAVRLTVTSFPREGKDGYEVSDDDSEKTEQ